ncbi:hemin ABC transporter substrate-binding protein, partial [Cribrihabitans sp. XS_ASV171]
QTSTYPPAAETLPDIGYARALSPEGVLSVSPDLVIATEGAGPPETLSVLAETEVDWVSVPESYSADGVLDKIAVVGKALGLEDEAKKLSERVSADLARVAEHVAGIGTEKPRVLFILSAANGRIMAAGDDTGAAGILDLAGARNAMTGFTGYKPVTDEAILSAAPQAILMMDRSGDHAIRDEDLFRLPAIAATPAAQTRTVIRMDGGQLLGFGPRTAQAIAELSEALARMKHP